MVDGGLVLDIVWSRIDVGLDCLGMESDCYLNWRKNSYLMGEMKIGLGGQIRVK